MTPRQARGKRDHTEAVYALGVRGLALPEALRVFIAFSLFFIWPVFALYASAHPAALSKFPTFAFAWLALDLTLRDLHLLRLPDNIKYAPKEYYETIRIRIAYSGSLALLAICIFIAHNVLPTATGWIVGKDVAPIDMSNELSTVGTFLGLAAVVALRASGSAARSEAIHFAEQCEKSANDSYRDRVRCSKDPARACPALQRGKGAPVNHARARRPRRASLVHSAWSLSFTILTLISLRLGNRHAESTNSSDDRSLLYCYILILGILLICFSWASSAFPGRIGKFALKFEHMMDSQAESRPRVFKFCLALFILAAVGLPLWLVSGAPYSPW